jgi:hypothetical protein
MTNKIIGVSGKKRHGKDTVGNIILAQRPTAVKIAYADSLKYEVASMIADYCRKQWLRDYDSPEENEAFRSSFIQTTISKMNDDTIDPTTGAAVKERYRLILQWWGTEFRRQMFGDDYWRQRLAEKIARLEPDQLAIITDVRFPDEADQIKELGGILVRVVRPGMPDTGNHSSETALDHYGKVALDTVLGEMFDPLGEKLPVVEQNDWDVVLTNDGTLAGLEKKVKEVLTTYGY